MKYRAKQSVGFINLALLLGWSGMIFILSSVSGNQYPQVSFPHADKMVHFGLYLVLGFLAAWVFKTRGYATTVPMLYGFLYGASDEIHQLWVPQRSCSLADWFADAAGTMAGIGIYLCLQRKLNSTKQQQSATNPETTESLELT